MILPIYAYGSEVLRKVAKDIDSNYPNLKELINNMYETMYNANGIGLAAPQVGLGIRLFIVDGSEVDTIKPKNFKQVFINPEIIEEWDDEWPYEEGCLSIPNIRADVYRPAKLRIHYYDENFMEKTEDFDGMEARIIQHEYDHIEGILFTDHISPLKRNMLKSKLNSISIGRVNIGYKMKFPK